MTEQERQERFLEGMKELENKFGVTVVSTVNTKSYGAMLQIEPGTPQLALIQDWKAPKDKDVVAP